MRKLRRYLLAAVLFTLLLGSSWAVFANGGDTYDLSWFTLESTQLSSGDEFALNGSSGQPDAAASEGNGFTLQGGFWHVTAAGGYEVLLPVIVR